MIFFLAFPFLALLLAMLFAAALTFTFSSFFPALRAYAITAPVAAFLISPALLFPVSLLVYGHMFIMDPPIGSASFWIRFATGDLLITAGCLIVAYLATIICRVIFELVPAFLAQTFGFKANLLLQSAIFAGGLLSCPVLVVSFCFLSYLSRGNLILVSLCGLLGILTAGICARAVLRLSETDEYRPHAMPGWLRRILFARA